MEETKLKEEAVDSAIPKKLSYEELENVAKQLSEQNRIMYRRIQELETNQMFARLGFLFKVVEFANRFNSEFLNNCTKEIEELITIPEEKPQEESK